MSEDGRPEQPREPPSDDEEASGNGAIYGVLFAIALTIGALYLVQRMRDSASLLECAFTHAPKCRELIKE